jgi:glyoxylase-like metal-dependent hydrolase (beta-lactamase superfamily II)/rhodanese-related sulfurtransferase
MIFTQYYLDCLSQASYLIADETSRRAVVVDPRRDIEDYLADAAEQELTIIGVINTHFHADFVSGHLELAQATGAWIGYGAAASAEFEIRSLHDGERISLGDDEGVTLSILATPGHTPESISILVLEHGDDDTPWGVLTGDALFIGDVGRPDLLASIGVTAAELGRMLHDSVQRKLMSLPDGVRVFPAHGAGSACGKNLSTERQSTIGEQRRTNYACRPMSADDFLAIVTEGQPSAPGYFVHDATINRQEREVREVGAQVPALTWDQVATAVAGGARVHDARDPQDFARGHLAAAINVPADGRMAETVGMVFAPSDQIVVVAPDGSEQEVATRIARIGFDHVVGFLADPERAMLAHPECVERASRLTVAQAETALADARVQLVDIRNPGEVAAGMIPGAHHIPLAELVARRGDLDPARPVLVTCAGGWRSSVGASTLRSLGFPDVSDLLGGYAAWEKAHPKAG